MQDEARPERRISVKPHLFEVLILVQLVVFQLWASTLDFAPGPGEIAASTLGVGRVLFVLIAIGVAVRAIHGAITGRLKDLVAIWKSPAWLISTARLLVFGALLSYEYTWMKLLIPVLHGRNFDGVFWQIDTWMMLGHSPNILFLNLFAPSGAVVIFDRLYGELFIKTLLAAIAFFLSSADDSRRAFFANSLSILWLGGVWMYVATPSVGPCYAYPQVFADWWASMPQSHFTQKALYENYGRVLRAAQGEQLLVNPVFGVAAFPSLHVGLVSMVALMLRRYHRRFQLAGWILAGFMVLGSVVTGWHYLVDSVGGIGLAVLGAFVAMRTGRLRVFAESTYEVDKDESDKAGKKEEPVTDESDRSA